MQIFFSESQVDYTTYTFNYAVYCLKETQEELPAIYAKGFLPYTGNLELEAEYFYLARSVRVNLADFEDSSENRRVGRKMEDLNPQLKLSKKSEIDTDSSAFVNFCMEYASERFSGNAMTQERFKYVLSRSTASHIFTFYNQNGVLGYVLAAIEGDSLHYWFSFFDAQYLKSHSLGKWMMWRVIRWAKDNGLNYAYLGTCYNKYALYKARDHKGVAFFDGRTWNTDLKLLKQWCKTDSEPKTMDRFKMPSP